MSTKRFEDASQSSHAVESSALISDRPAVRRPLGPQAKPERRAGTGIGAWYFISLAAFATVAGVVAAYHEMWLDELNMWTMARASATPLELIHHLRYDSTPPLWQLCLYVLTRFTANPHWMQVLHVTLATVSAGIFLRFAPFPRLINILFIFGYFPLYEYGIISRHYVLTELFLFAFLAFYPWNSRRAWWAGLMLFFESQTSFFGLVIAFAGALAMLVQHRAAGSLHRTNRALIAGLAVCGLGIVSALWLVRQHPDSAVHRAWDFINEWHAMQTAAIPWRVVVPVPAPRVEFWNSNFLDNFAALDTSHNAPTLLLQGVLSAGILGVTLWLLRKQRVALVLFGTITLGCLSFFYLKKVGYIRHHGHVFLAWIGAAWLVFAPQNSAILGDRERRNWTTLLVLVLGAQLVGSIAACAADLRGRFSAGDAVSEWIVARGYQDRVLVAPADIAALLQREVYLPFNDRFGTFLYYRRPWHRLKPADLAPLAKQLERERGKRCLLIIPADVFDWTLPGFRVEGCRELARWDDCFMQTGKMIAFELSDSD